jgi:hypothetical protein
MKPMNRSSAIGSRLTWLFATWLMCCIATATGRAADPLLVLEYRVTGLQLKVSPAVVSVPKGVPGSILPRIVAGEETGTPATIAAGTGAHIEATLRGPGLPEARRLVGAPDAALMLPPLNLVGDYQLDNIRLVDSATGAVRLEGEPAGVPVRVFDEVLVSKVTSRPLTTDEIQQKGIVIDDRNFRAVEFEVGFVLDGKTVPVRFPVVAPRFSGNGEIIPAAELEKRLADAALINQQLGGTTQLPPELEASRVNIQVQGVNFQRVDVGDGDSLGLSIPPIPALVVIPGNIGFLNQFFSVQIFTENAAPGGSGLSAFNIQARMALPPGPDRLVSTNYDQPGDDPLRFARVGTGAAIQPVQSVVRPGPDGRIGTSDDIGRLFPGETGQGEFLVEGLQEGLHVMDLELTADLDGLAAGTVQIRGRAAGSVLVRNPRFSLAFTHPRTIRAGEPYEASVTVLNTGITPANLVSISLPSASLSGGVLESAESVQLGTILPGQTATATYRVRAQRTGSIQFSNLTTGDESVQGRFRLRMGIDERGVALSPDSLALPDQVTHLPAGILAAANRVLGQGIGVATAAQLPTGVLPVAKSILTTRALELAEAGQRLSYGESLSRVLADLMLDWQGGRSFNGGFDQILRETDAGREWRAALAAAIESADGLDAVGRMTSQAPDLTGRGEPFVMAATTEGSVELQNGAPDRWATVTRSGEPRALVYGGARGSWAVAGGGAGGSVVWRFPGLVRSAELSVLESSTNGTARLLRWTVADPLPEACYRYTPGGMELAMDIDCDGGSDSTFAAQVTVVREAVPTVLAALQDLDILAGRPGASCLPAPGRNYGTVLAVLFSKPMTQAQVDVPSAYALDNGNVAGSVQIQPGGRVALLNMRRTFGGIRPRSLTVSGVTDPRGNPVVAAAVPIGRGTTQGVAIRGRVVRADGSPAVAVPVTLTEYDQKFDTGFSSSCESWIQRPMQVFTDANGFFEIDYVMSGIPFSVSATDTAGLPPEAVQMLLDSAEGDAFARNRLRELAEAASARGTLGAAFGTGSVTEAIARVEGLDRALLRDSVIQGSPREGGEMFVALRFRGRGTVAGTVLAPDGVTPVGQVAVNLFPDPDSREQGRGLFTGSDGRFRFEGVPLGLYTVSATAASGASRTVAGVLSEVGTVDTVDLVLGEQVVPRASLAGQVFETDNATPHADGRVFVGRFGPSGLGGIVAAVDCDASGFWAATNIPAGVYDVVAVSADGRRKGERRDVQAAAGGSRFVSIALQGRATVIGRVETANGVPVANALVAGGEGVVRTGVDGTFELGGVPIGLRTISAGAERTTDPTQPRSNPAFDFPRLGSASLNVLAGVENVVVVRLGALGRIAGRVLDVLGQPVPNVRVAIPQDQGFMWVEADGQGNYLFEGLQLGGYQLSAPAPGTATTDTSGLVSRIRTGSEEEIQAAIGEAFRIFTGLADPYLNPTNFNPRTWGHSAARLAFDGQTVVSDIRFLREGTVSGRVLNAQGVPIGARVRLTGVGPLANGAPSTIIRGEANSDPALGTFMFEGALLAGPWGLQAASPFYPTIPTASGATTQLDPDVTGIELRFPPVQEVNGRLVGRVFQPDGSPVGSNVNVRISFGTDYVVRTDAEGRYDTQIALPAGNYTLQAEDPASGLRGVAGVGVTAGVTNTGNVQLLGKGGIRVTVRQANGLPAVGADVEIQQGGYPGDRYSGRTDATGVLLVENVFEGPYGIGASAIVGPVRVSGRSGARVVQGGTADVTVTLAPTATLRGTFVKRDLVTPVPFAQVAIGDLGYAATDARGFFEIVGVPLGSYRLVSQDPVSGVAAALQVTLGVQGEVRTVQLVEQARGEIRGRVIGSFGSNTVAAASVTLQVHDGLTAARTVTTGPDGGFSFPGSAAGAFTVTARDPVSGLTGSASATLPANAAVAEVSVRIQPLGFLAVRVLRPDGVTPAVGANVRLSGPRSATLDSDADGRVVFAAIPMGGYSVRADSRVLAESRSASETSVGLGRAGETVETTLVLNGVGTVTGRVFRSDGVTPAAGVDVRLTSQAPLFSGTTVGTLTDAEGRYDFGNVPAGAFAVSATAQALAAAGSGRLLRDGDAAVVDLVLGDSGWVVGRLVRADGVTPVVDLDVLLSFRSLSGRSGLAMVRSGTNGTFQFESVPVGTFELESVGPAFGGIARASSTLVSNGQTNDLGAVVFDEADPRVIAVTPGHSAIDVPTTTVVELTFSEALDPATVTPDGIYLRTTTGTAPATVQLLSDPTDGLARLVRLTPTAPLRSQLSYEVVVVDGERRNAFGQVTASGPRDRVGRPLVVPFLARFTTADNDPPHLLSIFPTDGAVQVDPRTVVRLSFSEPIRTTDLVVRVTGPAGPVAGVVSVGVNSLVVNFTPEAALPANQRFTLLVDQVRDEAGNPALGQPFQAVFETLDTVGPSISSLRMADGRSPIAGSTVTIEAVLASIETNATVRFTQDLVSLAGPVGPPYRTSISLPASGSTTIRAIASDRYGNEGPLAELRLATVPNTPPSIVLERIDPPSGPVGNGEEFRVRVAATDELSVTNLTLMGAGQVSFSTNLPDGSPREWTFRMPADAPADSVARFTAFAVDGMGVVSSEAVLEVSVRDTVVPFVEVLSPLADGVLTGDVLVRTRDNSSPYLLEVRLSGGVTLTQSMSVAVLPNVDATNRLTFDLSGAPANGADVQATIVVTDARTNVTTLTRPYRLPDVQPPRLVSTSPAPGALRRSLWQDVVSFGFDEALDPATVRAESVGVTDDTGASVVRSLSLSADGRRVDARLVTPMVPGRIHTNWLGVSIADRAGNRWQRADGAAVSAGGEESVFTTAAILDVLPAAGLTRMSGQQFPAEVGYEEGLGATRFRFTLEGSPAVEVVAGATRASAQIPVPVVPAPGPVLLRIQAAPDDAFSTPIDLPPVVVTVLPVGVDTDGDGVGDAFELANGLDPLGNDGEQDPDGDGLTNRGEFEAGSDPRRADTDGDTLNDGAEVALGTDPTNRDTDGDGLDDNLDPRPLVVDGGVTIEGLALVPMVPGGSTQVVFHATASSSPIVRFEVLEARSTPAWVTTRSVELTNTATGGTGALTLELNPLHDATGNVRFTVRATAANGRSGTFDVMVEVEEAPVLEVTRWVAPVSGEWNDPARWSAGVPSTGRVAVVDTAGSYTVRVAGTTVTAAGVIFEAPDATMSVAAATFDAPVQFRAGSLFVEDHQGLTLNRAWAHRGRWTQRSRDVNSYVSGAGHVDLLGQIIVQPIGGSGGWAQFRVPVHAGTGSTVQVAGEGRLGFWTGGSLVTSGDVDLRPGAVMIAANDGPSRAFQLMAGTRLTGGGVLELQGANRLAVHGVVDVGIATVLQGSATADGTGHLSYRLDQTLVGPWNVALTVATNVTLGSSGAVFGRTVGVEPGATLVIPGQQSLTINGSLTNRGTLRMFSRDVNTSLQGSGMVFNEGLLRVEPVGGSGGFARLHVRLRNQPGAAVEVRPGAQLTMGAGGTIESAGQLRVDGYLAIENTAAAPAVTLASGAGVDGNGVVRFHGSSRLVVEAPVSFAANLELVESSRAEGPGPLRLENDQNLTGRYGGPVVLTSTSAVGFASPVFEDALTIEDGAGAFVHGNQALTIDGLMTNRSTLRMFSRDLNTVLRGSGTVFNEGTLRVEPLGGSGGFARLHVRLQNQAGATLEVRPGAQLTMGLGGAIESAGQIQVDGYLAIENTTPARAVTLANGAGVDGAGVVRFHGSSRLVVEAPVSFAANLELAESSRAEGTGPLTLLGDQNPTGRYQVPVVLAAASTVGFASPVFEGSLTIEDGADAFIHGNQALTVNGVMTNRSTLRMFSRDVNTWLQGSGTVFNEGTLRVEPLGGSGGFARLHVRVQNRAGATLEIRPAAQLLLGAGGAIESAGRLLVDGYLAIENTTPALSVRLTDGAGVDGGGVVRFHGSSRLIVEAPVSFSANLELVESSGAEGAGPLTLLADQSLTGRYRGPVVLASDSTVGFASPVFEDALTIEAGAAAFVQGNQALTVDGTMTNRSTLRMFSRDVNTWLQGSGAVFNEGTLRVEPVGGSGGFARLHVRLQNQAGATLEVRPGAQLLMGAGGAIESAGRLLVDGYLAIENTTPARVVTLTNGAGVDGGGVIRFHGSSRLVVEAPVAFAANLELVESSRAEGPGLLRLESDQNLSGRYLGPVQLASNSVVGFASPVFTGPVDVEPGADTFIHFNQTLTVDGALTNRGSLRMFSRDVNTWLSGAGVVINPGLIRVIPVGGSGGWARVHVRVEVPAGGIYRVEQAAINAFGAGGNLLVAGELNVVGALQFWNEGPARSLALAHGGRRTGTGTIDLLGLNRFEVTGDATLESGLINLVESSQMAGDGTLSVLAGATLRFDHPVTFPGSMLVSGTLTTVSGTSRIGGTLTLGVGGVLNNPASLEVGAFADLGGTVNGAMPVVVGFGPGGFTIRTILLEDPVLGTRRAGPTIEGEARVVLECTGPAKGRFTVEVSTDLLGWRALSVVVEEVSPGRYRVQVPQGAPSGDGVFFRLVR